MKFGSSSRLLPSIRPYDGGGGDDDDDDDDGRERGRADFPDVWRKSADERVRNVVERLTDRGMTE